MPTDAVWLFLINYGSPVFKLHAHIRKSDETEKMIRLSEIYKKLEYHPSFLHSQLIFMHIGRVD